MFKCNLSLLLLPRLLQPSLQVKCLFHKHLLLTLLVPTPPRVLAVSHFPHNFQLPLILIVGLFEYFSFAFPRSELSLSLLQHFERNAEGVEPLVRNLDVNRFLESGH
jgi:hypothetical protein